MNNSNKVKVLLYSDGSQNSFSAAVYTATLVKSLPNLKVTVVQVQENGESPIKSDKRLDDLNSWPVSPITDWLRRVIKETNSTEKSIYDEIIDKTNGIFFEKGINVNHQVLYSDTTIADTVNVILDYATNKSFQFIIIGAQQLTALKRLLFGCLAQSVLNKSSLPVLIIK